MTSALEVYQLGKSAGDDLKDDVSTILEQFEASLQLVFIRGYFDSRGYINPSPMQCGLYGKDLQTLQSIQRVLNIKSKISVIQLEFNGSSVIEFLDKIYSNVDENSPYYNPSHYSCYKKIKYYHPWTSSNPVFKFRYAKTQKEAIAPFKNKITDTGYDLTLIRFIKEQNGVLYYGTGIKIQPDYGFYFDLVPRSSICKTGYIMANSIGILDHSFSGEIIVPLIKINKNLEDLLLPCRLMQLIPRQLILMDAVEVDELMETTRGDDGGVVRIAKN
jgi:dUTP pyrophosphatase